MKQKHKPGDFIGVLTFLILTLGLVAGGFYFNSLDSSSWNKIGTSLYVGAMIYVVAAFGVLYACKEIPIQVQKGIADKKYRNWVNDILYPYLEAKYGVKLTGNIMNFETIMAEKDGDIFEVQIFGITHLRSNTTDQNVLWSHPLITGDIELKEVIRPDAVRFQNIPEVN